MRPVRDRSEGAGVSAEATRPVVRVGAHGPIFELREPFTVESVKEDAGRQHGRGLCRIKHRWRVIGDPYLPEDDPLTMVLSLVASSTYDRLVRCQRCGQVSMRGRP